MQQAQTDSSRPLAKAAEFIHTLIPAEISVALKSWGGTIQTTGSQVIGSFCCEQRNYIAPSERMSHERRHGHNKKYVNN